MQILINILPQEEKAVMRRILRTRTILTHGVFLVSILIVVMGTLWLLLIAARVEKDGLRIVEESIVRREDMHEMHQGDNTIAHVNRIVRTAQKMAKMQKHPSEVLRTLTAIAPPSLRAEEMQIIGDIVSIKGEAAARSDVIALKETLEKSPCFDTVVLPLTSLVDRHDTKFTITARTIPCQ